MAKKSGKSRGKRVSSAVTAKKQASSKAASTAAQQPHSVGPRQLKAATPAARQFWKKGPRTPQKKLPSVWSLTRQASQIIWDNKKLFFGITLIYGLLNLVLVQGLSSGSTDVSSLKSSFDQAFTGHFGSLASSFSVFVALVGSSGNGSSQAAGGYQLFLGLVVSLALIWALRQRYNGQLIRIRDAYYKGMYPLVPFILVLLVVGLELIPFIAAALVYALIVNNGIITVVFEQLILLILVIAVSLWSFYMASAAVIALYIATLPDMMPKQALRSARELVNGRRWTVLRKILALPIVLFIIAAVIMLPIILWLTALSSWIFFILTMFVLTAVHAYMYTLYRELLHE